MALTCGLDLPIMNPGAPDMVRAVDTYKLIMNMDKGAKNYIDKYRTEIGEKAVAVVSEVKKDGGDENVSQLEFAINNGLPAKCKELVGVELEYREPMDIINNTLIPILDRAGKQFEKGLIFIPQLMLCASTAQTAFEVIKERLDASGEEKASMGKIVIATVEGDIHDIGKNIVKVILENYGYEIIDLGKDVPPQKIADTVITEGIKLLGLSALMTTTLPAMVKSIELVKAAVPECKIMVGGAVLTEDYAMQIGADYYVKDAKASADVAKIVLK